MGALLIYAHSFVQIIHSEGEDSSSQLKGQVKTTNGVTKAKLLFHECHFGNTEIQNVQDQILVKINGRYPPQRIWLCSST